jgi:hypothetical protein
MSTIRATVKNGRLDLTVPTDWPDGTEVEIHPVGKEASDAADIMSPDEIARTLAAMDLIEPFDMSEEERARL